MYGDKLWRKLIVVHAMALKLLKGPARRGLAARHGGLVLEPPRNRFFQRQRLYLVDPLCALIAAVLVQDQLDDPALCIGFESDLRIDNLVEELAITTGIDRRARLSCRLYVELIAFAVDRENERGTELMVSKVTVKASLVDGDRSRGAVGDLRASRERVCSGHMGNGLFRTHRQRSRRGQPTKGCWVHSRAIIRESLGPNVAVAREVVGDLPTVFVGERELRHHGVKSMLQKLAKEYSRCSKQTARLSFLEIEIRAESGESLKKPSLNRAGDYRD
jgi:hypothetical protein